LHLCVISPFVDKKHGTERAIAELVEHLASDFGHAVHVYSQRMDDVEFSSTQESGRRAGSIYWRRVRSIVVEMGIGGLILWLIMATAIGISGWKIVNKLRGTSWFPIGMVIFWYSFLMLFPYMIGGIQSYEDFILNAYLWLLIGILFRLPDIKISTEIAAAESALAQSRQRWIL
jgi:hypothetical protein